MSSIDTLKSNISSGLARSNRYRVLFHTNNEILDVLCDSVGWPGRQIFTSERLTDTKTRKVAYGFGQEDLPVSFLLTNDWRTWDFIYEWHERIINNVGATGGFTVNFKNTYTEDIEIHHLGTSNDIKRKIKLKNAFPTTLSALELGNGNENELLRVTTECSYDNWETIDS